MKENDDNLYRFAWSVPEAGFCWENEGKPTGKYPAVDTTPPWLIINAHPDECWAQGYFPLEEQPLLFRVFSKLDGSPDNILDFANKYGNLSYSNQITRDSIEIWENETTPDLKHKKGEKYISGSLTPGVSLIRWRRSIQEMASLLEVWDLIQDVRVIDLEKYIKWWPDGLGVSFQWENKKLGWKTNEIIATANQFPEYFTKWEKKNKAFKLEKAARLLLALKINKTLHGKISPYTTLDEDGKMESYLMPNDLLSAMWLQFQWAVTGKKKFRRCSICQNWMEVTDNRKSKTTHVKCSKNQYAEERRKAIAMWEQGKTIEEIVNEINKDKDESDKKREPDKIMDWIEKHKEGNGL